MANDHSEKAQGPEQIEIPENLFTDEVLLSEDIDALMEAAALIARNPESYEGELRLFRDHVGEVMIGRGLSGAFIKDKNSGDRLVVRKEKTEIDKTGSEKISVPTYLLFDMVYRWDEIIRPQESSELEAQSQEPDETK